MDSHDRKYYLAREDILQKYRDLVQELIKHRDVLKEEHGMKGAIFPIYECGLKLGSIGWCSVLDNDRDR